MLARCSPRVELRALADIPIASPGDDLPAVIARGLDHNGIALQDCDVLVVTSKIASRCEDRFVDLATVTPSARARELAATTGHDPRLVELIVRESSAVSRAAPGVLIVRHRLGCVSANAGIDHSNAAPPSAPPGSGPWVLLLPEYPDRTAERIRAAMRARFHVNIGVVLSDSHGRPFRLGTLGVALGVAGVPALCDLRGERDLFDRPLAHTFTALADQIATAADLVAGQAGEGRAVVHVRGLSFEPGDHAASALHRPADRDLYA